MRTYPLRHIPCNAIITALRESLPLSTDMLATKAGVAAGLTEAEYLTNEWRSKIYRNANHLFQSGTLLSEKVYNGKVYERVWRLRSSTTTP